MTRARAASSAKSQEGGSEKKLSIRQKNNVWRPISGGRRWSVNSPHWPYENSGPFDPTGRESNNIISEFERYDVL